ncbi:hypothetical protein NE237_011439 [Protea cynaroides]|uniref:Uncharacterized protein n=1 Tax=Protea cynaroides TaxID=273540 RepID=A0A9Q0GX23_9MAGN|nr:hypothetical protein NE237_011439 [Protea cynaroides]
MDTKLLAIVMMRVCGLERSLKAPASVAVEPNGGCRDARKNQVRSFAAAIKASSLPNVDKLREPEVVGGITRIPQVGVNRIWFKYGSGVLVKLRYNLCGFRGRPYFNMNCQTMTNHLQWVHFPDLLQDYWNEAILLSLAKATGRLISIDKRTQNAVFVHFARVCVELSFQAMH